MKKKYFAPGRVNLIGEHLDYNGGLVLPAALTIGITAHYTKRDDNKIVLRSKTHSFSKELFVGDPITYDTKNDWTNYPLGVINQLGDEGHFIPSCEIIFESNLPEGSGLSSSAAIEVLTAYIILSQSETKIDPVWLAHLCRQVENEFIGVKCGIMDQFSVAMGKANNAILLDCNTLEHTYVPLYLDDYRLMVLNSCKPRSLITSKYNERKEQSEKALHVIQATSDVKHLADISGAQLDLIPDEVIRRRAKHVFTENLRVKESIKALRLNDLTTFGRLMNASHTSMKEDYEVTGIEMDTLVDAAQQTKGCLGARMTGGGFGGCAIALVHKNAIEELINKVSQQYHSATGLNCQIYESEIGDGVRAI